MIAITVRNVNEALPEACHRMLLHGEKGNSRNGRVLSYRGVFSTEYQRPVERVLFDPVRDCNPFFHLFEAVWMLAGRNDVAFVSQFSGNIADYSDDGISFSAAYGFRWRKWYSHDQLRWVAGRLQKDPDDRRAVLAIWDGRMDPSIADRDGKDIPCNLSVSFHRRGDELDMFVFNRSNDLIWGSYGANVVHFSVMQEYVAAMVGCKVGRYSQVSSNTHVYERHWSMTEQLASQTRYRREDTVLNPYATGTVCLPLLLTGEEVSALDLDVQTFVNDGWDSPHYFTSFFKQVVLPMRRAHAAFSQRENQTRILDALGVVAGMPDCDWKLASQQWLERRIK